MLGGSAQFFGGDVHDALHGACNVRCLAPVQQVFAGIHGDELGTVGGNEQLPAVLPLEIVEFAVAERVLGQLVERVGDDVHDLAGVMVVAAKIDLHETAVGVLCKRRLDGVDQSFALAQIKIEQ